MASASIPLLTEVYELKESGMNNSQVAKATGTTREQVRRWWSFPEKYSPYLDEIAIERAINGDRKVFEALTDFERHEFWMRFIKRANSVDLELVKQDNNGGNWTNPYLTMMQSALGMSGKALTSAMHCAKETAERRAAPVKPVRRGPGRNSKLTEEEQAETIAAVQGGESQRSVAQRFGVSRSCVWRVVRAAGV